MTYIELEKTLLEKPGAWLDYPFGEGAAVFKIGPKMFALVSWNEDPLSINLKCDPELAIELREPSNFSTDIFQFLSNIT